MGVFFIRIKNYFDKKKFFTIWPKISYMLENFFFWKNNNNNHKYNYPKNILKKKRYFFKINRKNSKIDRRTKSFGYDIKKILKDNQKKIFCPKVIINIFYEFFSALSTIRYKLLKPGRSNTYLFKVKCIDNRVFIIKLLNGSDC